MSSATGDEKLEAIEPPVPTDDRSSGSIHDHDRLQHAETKTDDQDGADDDDDAQKAGLAKTLTLEKRVSLPREILVVGVICLAQFTTQLGLGQMLAITHVVGDAFGITNPGTLSWLIAGYSLTVGSFVLFSGRLGDIFGYKTMLIIGYVWFALWSVVAGLAVYSNSVLFIFARVLQGIGPSICLPNGLALLGALYEPGRRKNMCFSVFGACAPGGSMVGSAFAGLFTLAWWPWTFWTFGVALALIAVVGSSVIPDPQVEAKYDGRGFRALAEQLDLLGASVGITGLILFNLAWNQAPISGWGSFVIAPLVLGLALVFTFFYIERRVAVHPLIPFEALTINNCFVLGCVMCGWACFGIWVYYTWQILEVLRGATPLLATAYLSPLAVSGAVAAVTTGFVLSHMHPAYVMMIALTAFMVGTILIATAPVHQIYWGQIFFCAIVTPWGMDMSFPAATLVISNSVSKQNQGVAASLVNTVVNYSISLGLGFAGTVEINVNGGGETDAQKLKGYRAALYLGIGFAGLGLGLAALFRLRDFLRHRSSPDVADDAAEKAADGADSSRERRSL